MSGPKILSEAAASKFILVCEKKKFATEMKGEPEEDISFLGNTFTPHRIATLHTFGNIDLSGGQSDTVLNIFAYKQQIKVKSVLQENRHEDGQSKETGGKREMIRSVSSTSIQSTHSFTSFGDDNSSPNVSA